MNILSRNEICESDRWSDWHWQLSNSIRKIEELEQWVDLTEDERKVIKDSENRFRWQITPYYAALMDKHDSNCPIRLQAIPSRQELMTHANSDVDPVGDMQYRKTNRVVHKYHDRVIMLVTQNCPVYCRHCTRKFHTTEKQQSYFAEGEGSSYDADFEYIAAHPEIRDVLLTGGDPLTYNDRRIEQILARLRDIPHVEIIRIGSRYPVLLPQRITDDFCAMLERYHPVWFSTHFNHPSEITAEAAAACDRLLRAGVPVQNQTVLLKGINDDVETMRALLCRLLEIRVKPYYLYHCDNVSGVSHFMTDIERGNAIMEALTGHISGYAIPRYIVTTKLGKIPLEKSYVTQKDGKIILRSHTGQTMTINALDDVALQAEVLPQHD